MSPTTVLEEPKFEMAIGDLASSAKGTAARANGGKPDLSLIPLTFIANSFGAQDTNSRALQALGRFQVTRNTNFLYVVMDELGLDGWLECAAVFEYGKRKYKAWNWAKGMSWTAVIASAARHLLAMLRGEVNDEESGLPHRGHVFCNLVMLLQYTITFTEGDDLAPEGLL